MLINVVEILLCEIVTVAPVHIIDGSDFVVGLTSHNNTILVTRGYFSSFIVQYDVESFHELQEHNQTLRNIPRIFITDRDITWNISESLIVFW